MTSQIVTPEAGHCMLAICHRTYHCDLLIRQARFSLFMARVLNDRKKKGDMMTLLGLALARRSALQLKGK